MTVIGKWCPCPCLHPWAFHRTFSPCAVEKGQW